MGYEYVDFPPEFRALLEKIFHEDFMRKHTRFESFEAFQYSSAVFVNWKSDQLVYSRTVFDNFVKESTNFTSWEEMVKIGTDSYFSSVEAAEAP